MSVDERIIINDMAGDSQMDFIIQEAAKRGASDIHIDPLPNEVLIRFRIDGVLREANRFPREYLDHVINQLKVLSNLEIGTVRLPEDGHFSARLSENGTATDRLLDVRVSIFPA